MILKRLAEFAHRIQDLPPSMYKPQRVNWQIELDTDGNYLDITPLSDGTKKNLGLEIISPSRKRPGITPPPLLLCDKASYVLGLEADSPGDSWQFKEFYKLVEDCAKATQEPAVQAVCNFLNSHQLSPTKFKEEIMPEDWVCFRVNGIRPTDLQSVKLFWAEINSDHDAQGQCLVCGRIGPVDRVSPIAISGLGRIGGNPSGMAVVSANKDAFLSFGAKQSLIAPTCRACGEAYANAINYMLSKERYRIFIGPAAFLFWTQEESAFNPAALLTQPQEEDVHQLLDSYRTGLPANTGRADAFYAVSMSASNARVAIRDWLETTIPRAEVNLARWFNLQRIVDWDGTIGRPLSVYALASSLYLKPNEQMVANVPRALVRCAIYGGPMPTWLLAQAIGRNCAERNVPRNRIALIKAVLASQQNSFKEGNMEKLDLKCNSPGYLCGRLLAELEGAQKAAVNPNSTLVDRYYGAASSAPATVFGNLLKNLQAHMSKLRRDKPGVFIGIDTRLQEIMSSIDEFPKVLTLKEQALFALGYYHQKAANRAAAIARANGKSTEEDIQ